MEMAARMGDMQVCPMVTPGVPPIPHLGGTIILGSLGVMIGDIGSGSGDEAGGGGGGGSASAASA